MTRQRSTDLLFFALTLFAALSFTAGLLYVLHGFAGGRGHDDWLLALLGVPGSIALPLVPEAYLGHADWFNIIVLPWLLNSALAIFLYIATRPFTSSTSPEPPRPLPAAAPIPRIQDLRAARRRPATHRRTGPVDRESAGGSTPL